MEKALSRLDLPHDGAARVCLMLRDERGGHWSVTMSPGMERFIGVYPRIDAFRTDAPLLQYELS